MLFHDIILVFLFVFCLNTVILILFFRYKNKLATKIVKRLMKTQQIEGEEKNGGLVMEQFEQCHDEISTE